MFKASIHNCTLDKVGTIAQIIVDTMKAIDVKSCFFTGHIGTGKTTLIKEISKIINVQDTVSSPSFNIVNEYKTSNGNIIYHFDFYRIKDLSEAIDLGVLEYLNDKSAYNFIEWSENIGKLLTTNYILIAISSDNYNSRNYIVEQVKNEI